MPTMTIVPSAVIVASANAASSRVASLTDSMATIAEAPQMPVPVAISSVSGPRDAEHAAQQQRDAERDHEAADDHDDRAGAEVADRAEAEPDAEQRHAEPQHAAGGRPDAGLERRPHEPRVRDQRADRERPDERARAGHEVRDLIGDDHDHGDQREAGRCAASALGCGAHR